MTVERKTIYLSGPITGMPGKNHETFMSVARELRAMGHVVYNPREFVWIGDFPKRKAFAEYCAFICNRADTIVLLPGWQHSKGACAERALAENCSLEIVEWAAFEAPAYVPILDDVGGGA